MDNEESAVEIKEAKSEEETLKFDRKKIKVLK